MQPAETVDRVCEPFSAVDAGTTPLMDLRGDEGREELLERVAQHMERLGITEQDIEDEIRAVRSGR